MTQELLQQALRALVIAEAGLADIGDADREPGDDLAWCEARAAQALELPRAAIIALRAAIAQPVQPVVDLVQQALDAQRYRRIRNGPHSDRHGDLYAMTFQGDGDVPVNGQDLDQIVDASIASKEAVK